MKTKRKDLEEMLQTYSNMAADETLPRFDLGDLKAIAEIAGDDYSMTSWVAYRQGFIQGIRYAQKEQK